VYKHTTIYTIIKKNQKNIKEYNKRKIRISSKFHVIYISSNNVIDTLLLRLSLYFTRLHFTPLHYICRHFTSSHLNFTQLHITTLSFGLTLFKFPTAPFHLTSLHFTSLHFTALLEDFRHTSIPFISHLL